jgi:cation:H+ antiporter
VPTVLAIPLFLASAALTLAAAGFFADKLDHVGPRLGLPEAAVGLLTAVAADTPEIASAIVALASGDRKASLGVVLGSNAFNLAAMLGLGAVAAGSVAITRRPLAVESTVSLVALVLTAALVAGLLPAWLACTLFAVVLAGYLTLALGRPHEHAGPRPEGQIVRPLILIVPAVCLIVVGATGMVRTALTLADRWGISETVTGVLVLAVLTSLPNAFTAVRLAIGGRGEAVVTETQASNTINLAGGVLIPALFASFAAGGASVAFDFAWLLAMSVVSLAALAGPGGLGRRAGAVLIAMYAVFVAVHLAIS